MKYHSSEGIVQIGNCWIAKSLEEFVQKKLDQEARRAIVQTQTHKRYKRSSWSQPT